jgi:hypothetical protein
MFTGELLSLPPGRSISKDALLRIDELKRQIAADLKKED